MSLKDLAEQAAATTAAANEAQRLASLDQWRKDTENACRAWFIQHLKVNPDAIRPEERYSAHDGHDAEVEADGLRFLWSDNPTKHIAPYMRQPLAKDAPGCLLAHIRGGQHRPEQFVPYSPSSVSIIRSLTDLGNAIKRFKL